MSKNQQKNTENSKNQKVFSPKDYNFLLAREKNWMKNEFDELTEVGFRRWVGFKLLQAKCSNMF